MVYFAMAWEIRLTRDALKNLRRLPLRIIDTVQVLFAELELSGPIRTNWPHFGKLSRKNCYHCHVCRGRPTYVAVWQVMDKQGKIIEVIYVGTHERAHYDRLC